MDMNDPTMPEVWAPIPGYENRYMVSTHGRVMRVAYTYTRADGVAVRLPSKLLKAGADKSGYPTVHIGKVQRVHKLVMLTFVGERPAGMVIRHLNDVPNDNRLCNLRYGTRIENAADRYRNTPPDTVCQRGHEILGYNRLVTSSGTRCRACDRARSIRNRTPNLSPAEFEAIADKWAAIYVAGRERYRESKPQDVCKRGHVQTLETRRVDKQGKFEGCRPCRLATQRLNARVGVYTEVDIQTLSDEIYADLRSVESTSGQMMFAL